MDQHENRPLKKSLIERSSTREGSDVLKCYRAAADRIVDSAEREEFLRNIDILEKGPTLEELMKREENIKKLRCDDDFLKTPKGCVACELPYWIRIPAQLFLLAFVLLVGLLACNAIGESLMSPAIGLTFICFGSGGFIIFAYVIIQKRPIPRKGGDDIDYSKNPVKYAFYAFFLASLTLGAIAAGISALLD